MAKRGGAFSFAKRQKELARAKKKKEKLERKQAKNAGDDPGQAEDNPVTEDPDAPPAE